ncbi:MAG: hypothetical protein ACJAVK_002214 [Akkermansiaceae bacterium]|jgi:hypothetical protein
MRAKRHLRSRDWLALLGETAILTSGAVPDTAGSKSQLNKEGEFLGKKVPLRKITSGASIANGIKTRAKTPRHVVGALSGQSQMGVVLDHDAGQAEWVALKDSHHKKGLTEAVSRLRLHS